MERINVSLESNTTLNEPLIQRQLDKRAPRSTIPYYYHLDKTTIIVPEDYVLKLLYGPFNFSVISINNQLFDFAKSIS